MPNPTALAHRSLLRDAAVLAARHLLANGAPSPVWGDAEIAALRAAAGRLLVQQAECARVVGPAAARLVGGIGLVSYLGPASGLGPTWPAHPIASPGWYDARPLREPDATPGLATYMGAEAAHAAPNGPAASSESWLHLPAPTRSATLWTRLAGRWSRPNTPSNARCDPYEP